MIKTELNRALRRLQNERLHMSEAQRLAFAMQLLDCADALVAELRERVLENDAAAKRRKAKRRETEVDPKPPVKPVSVAEPAKPKKPKYRGLGT